MKEYVFFYSKAKNVNLFNVFKFVSDCVGFNKVVIFLMQHLLFFSFVLGVAFSNFNIYIKFFVTILSLAFIFYSFNGFRGKIYKKINFIFNETENRYCVEPLYKLIKLLIFIKFLEQSHKDIIPNAISYCDKEIANDNYYSLSSNPFLIIYISTLSALTVLFFNPEDSDHIKLYSFILIITYIMFFVVYNRINYIRPYLRVKKLCQWVECFDDEELMKIKDKLKLIGFN